MKPSAVLDFAARLSKEMEVVPRDQRDELLFSIGRCETTMRLEGQERPVWNGPMPEGEILGREVVAKTDQGERVGRVVFFGVARKGADYERSVILFVPASGTCHEVPGSDVKPAGSDDLQRMHRENFMATKLKEIVDEPVAPPKEKRPRAKKDELLVKDMLRAAADHPGQLSTQENKGFYRIERPASDSKRKIYISKGFNRLDLSGFTVDHPAVRQITEEESREAGLGAVRGQVEFFDRYASMDAFNLALKSL